jgi:ABC-type transport system involved in multi-copper enzyme maturation permease subunit
MAGVNILYYRPWRGQFRAPAWAVWPIARVALGMLWRRKLFWVLYAVGLFVFLMFFFGQFLLDWAETQIPSTLVIGRLRPGDLIARIRRVLKALSGSHETYKYFFSYQGTALVVMLTLAGSVLVGNDFVFGSLPFYLSKPVARWHYVLGKCLAVGVVINLMTTVPALVLYVQYGFGNWDYFLNVDYFRAADGSGGPAGVLLLAGILGYGLLLTVCLSLMLVATASWVRRTMPMIMVWTGLFLFLPLVAAILVDVLKYDERWRLLDMWNNLCLVGNTFLEIPEKDSRRGLQPDWYEALLVLGAVCVLCLSYLNLRTRAVEIIR